MAELNAIGIAVSNLRRSMEFYRLVGLDLPDDPAEGHVEATMASGTRLMFDTEEIIRTFLPEWARANGNQVSLAFECASPAEVDALYQRSSRRASKARRSRGMRSGANAMRCWATRTVFGSTSTRRSSSPECGPGPLLR